MYQPIYTITHEFKLQDTPPQQHGGVSCFFPAARGVVEFQAHDNSTLLLAATGNLRDFIAQRLNEANQPSARADLAPVTARISARPTGSAFESDLFVLERSRVADPDLYHKLTHQNRRSLLLLNPDTGTWRTAETIGLTLQPQERVIGPCLTNAAAQQLGEALDEAYELCRFPKQLALAPRGTACAYKEMGQCPAACDGSEPMHQYHDRFAQASTTASAGIGAWTDTLKQRMARASAELDFEAAALAKRHLERVHSLPRDALGAAASLHRFACVVVTPTIRQGWAQCWVFNDAGCTPVCSIGLLNNDLLASLPNRLESQCSTIGFEQHQLDRFSLIARHWLTKPSKQRKRRVSVIDTRSDGWKQQIRSAIEAAQSVRDPGHDDEEHTLLPV